MFVSMDPGMLEQIDEEAAAHGHSPRGSGSSLSFALARHACLRTRGGYPGLLEGDCSSPLRGIDSTESTELPFLRFAQGRLIRPSSPRIVSPGDKRQDRKRDRNGQRNHMPLGSTMFDHLRTA
jgi:hypothetical protein